MITADSGVLVGTIWFMESAIEKTPQEVLSDMKNDLARKRCTLLITFVISLLPLIILLLCQYYGFSQDKNLLENLFNANLAILGVDLAALAILFALFQDKELDDSAKNAFKEQSIAFVGNALLQIVAIMFNILNSICQSFCCAFYYISFIFQIWALIGVFDIIVELYTLITAIINNRK